MHGGNRAGGWVVVKIYMRKIMHPSTNDYGGGMNVFESERRRVLLEGYRVIEPHDQGIRYQAEGYDALITTPNGQLYAVSVHLEEGEE